MSENSKNYFFWNEPAFENAVKERVCPRCAYVGRESECGNPDPRGCALFRYLPDLVRIAQNMQDPDAKKYAQAVDEAARFELALYGLEGLLPCVLETVLKTDKELEARPSELIGRPG